MVRPHRDDAAVETLVEGVSVPVKAVRLAAVAKLWQKWLLQHQSWLQT